MITLAKGVYDVFEILRTHSKDKDFNEEYTVYKFNNYRSAMVLAMYEDKGYLNSLWYENHHPIDLTKITSGDDPLITIGSITLGKGTIVRPIYLPDAIPPVTITKGSRMMPYSWESPETIFNIIMSGAEIHPNYGYCFLRGENIYIYPYIEKVTANGIFDDPTQIQINDNGLWRDKTLDDPYAIDNAMAQEIVLQILTKDYNLTMNQISDTLNDGQTKLNTFNPTSSQ